MVPVFNVVRNKFGFFVGHCTGVSTDSSIALLIKLNVTKYRNILCDQFNGHETTNSSTPSEIYFSNYDDCKKAVEWVKEQYLIYYLAS
jgi:hypothetical protein